MNFKNHILTIILIIIYTNILGQVTVVNDTEVPTIGCQGFSISLLNSNNILSSQNGIYSVSVCPNDSLNILAIGVYNANDSIYHQNDSTTSFIWQTNSNNYINQSYSSANTTPSIQKIELTAIDSNNCPSDDTLKIEIVNTSQYYFNGTNQSALQICKNDSIVLSANINMADTIYSDVSFRVIDTALITSTTPYSSSITINTGSNQLIQSTNDINFIATLENSYMGDLSISISCPNSQSATIMSYQGASTYMGEPITVNNSTQAGIGYEYHWNTHPNSSVIAGVSAIHSYTDILNNSHTNKNFLPPSTSYPINSTASGPYPINTYQPSTNFYSLIGCPIDGVWTISITDNYIADNGYIFNWGLDFNQSYNTFIIPQIASQSWNTSSSIINNNGNSITIQPTDTGYNQYTYSVIDSFACIFDTTLIVEVFPIPNIDLGNDTTICGNQSITLYSNNNAAAQFWSDNSTDFSINIDSTDIGFDSTLISIIVMSANGCINADTIQISFTNCTAINTSYNSIEKSYAFPNPNRGIFDIVCNTNNNNQIDIEIIDINGKTIKKHTIINPDDKLQYHIDISNYANGVYFIKLKESNKVEYLKLIKTNI